MQELLLKIGRGTEKPQVFLVYDRKYISKRGDLILVYVVKSGKGEEIGNFCAGRLCFYN